MSNEKFLYLFQNGYINSDGSENAKVLWEAAEKEAKKFADRVIRKFDTFEEVLFFIRFPVQMWMYSEQRNTEAA